jgi:uncharacterized membrane protein
VSDDARVRLPLVLVLVLVLVVGCGAPARTRHRAELALGASLLGVMAGGLTMAAWPAQKQVLIPITVTFGALAVASTTVYIVADSAVPK